MQNRCLFCSAIVMLVLMSHPMPAAGQCTKEQAFHKMTALNQYGTKLQAQFPADPRTADPEKTNAMVEKIKDYSSRLGQGGPLLAAGKYNEACALYDALARDYGVDLGKNNTLTLQQLEKTGGRTPGGECDVAQAAKRMADISAKFQQAYAQGRLTDAQSRQFGTDANPIGQVMSSDPSKACSMINELQEKYGL